MQVRRCAACRCRTRAGLPPGVPRRPFGTRLTAVVALLSGRYRPRRREVQQALQDLWGGRRSLGAVVRQERAESAALAPVVQEVRAAVQQANVVNLDETGWRQEQHRAWLWTAVTAELTVFLIDQSRGGGAVEALLGPEFGGLVGSDRWAAYRRFPAERRALCWAHLKRDFHALVDRGGAAAPIGRWGLAEIARLFALWHRFRAGEVSRKDVQRQLVPIQARMGRLLWRGEENPDHKAAALCRDLNRCWAALWTFARAEGVEPTTTVSERALRPAVLWRKGSFGSDSEAGSRFAERHLTVGASCRQPGRQLLEFLVAAGEAAVRGTPAPSLLPAPQGGLNAYHEDFHAQLAAHDRRGRGTTPGIALKLGAWNANAPVSALVYGAAIIGAGFLLSWAVEAFQVDVSQGLALGVLALIAILPEYIVDATFAWKAAEDPAYTHYAVANMTGANRILIGAAWPLVVLLAWLRFRHRAVTLERGHGLELVVLLVASIYAVTIPFKGEISLLDFVILGGIFAWYIWRLSRLPAEEPELIGPAATIAALPTWTRRLVTASLGIVAAIAIIFVAEPFAEALVETGTALGIDEFLPVQWLAPLASESPEFVVVALFAWRGATTPAMGALVSSKINQWTLLVGMLPLVYSVSLGKVAGLPLDSRQQGELFVTAAQTLLAVSMMLDLSLPWYGALILFALFVTQLVWQGHQITFSLIYFALTVAVVVYRRREIYQVLRDMRSLLRGPT